MPLPFGAFLISLLITLVLSTSDPHPPSWPSWTTAEDLLTHAPDHLRKLFAALDTDQPDLAPVHTSLQAGDTLAAAQQLLAHFRQVDRPWIAATLETPPAEEALPLANAMLADTVHLRDHTAQVPLTNQGGWQWDYTGPARDDEFSYALIGHKYLAALLVAAQLTGEARFVTKIDRILRDWIVHHPPPPAGDSVYLVQDPALTPTTRLLLLSSLQEQPEGNLRIVPLGSIPWEADIVEGQEAPVIQGWYSETYGTKAPNPTVVYSGTIDGPAAFIPPAAAPTAPSPRRRAAPATPPPRRAPPPR